MSTLGERLKAAGLNITEDAAREAAKIIFAEAKDYVIASPNKYDDLLLAIFPVLEVQLIEIIDKIDGEVDA